MKLLGKHPVGLSVLFSTEMWERFNFYGMRAIMTLYMVHALGFSEGNASKSYGAYLGLGYLATMLGGHLADKHWGNRKCLYVGSIMMLVAQLLLFMSGSIFANHLNISIGIFWIAIFLLIIGTGIFKPNISSMVGSLYKEGDNRLDNAYTIFYMGINLGALFGQIICSQLGDVSAIDPETNKMIRNLHAFRWGFLAASIGMFLGLVSFHLYKKHLRNPEGAFIGNKPERMIRITGNSTQTKDNSNILQTLLLSVVLSGIFFLLLRNEGDFFVIPLVYAFIYGLGISLVLSVLTNKTLSNDERKKIGVLIICSFFVIFFWAAFEQAGSSLTFIANNQTDTTVLGHNIPPSQIQVANGLFIILLAPVVVSFWSFLARKKREPNSFVKIAIGLLLLALGYYVIAWAVDGLKRTEKISLLWFIILYLLHTMGELSLSPIGLSLVYKLSPKRIVGLLLGIWFVASAAGYSLAGTLGALLPPNPMQYEQSAEKGIDLSAILNKQTPLTEPIQSTLHSLKIPTSFPKIIGIEIQNLHQFFMVFVILSATAGILLLIISPFLNKISKQ